MKPRRFSVCCGDVVMMHRRELEDASAQWISGCWRTLLNFTGLLGIQKAKAAKTNSVLNVAAVAEEQACCNPPAGGSQEWRSNTMKWSGDVGDEGGVEGAEGAQPVHVRWSFHDSLSYLKNRNTRERATLKIKRADTISDSSRPVATANSAALCKKEPSLYFKKTKKKRSYLMRATAKRNSLMMQKNIYK